jgi:hypothetical protein
MNNLKRLSKTAFHLVKIGNYFVHMAETSRLLEKIGESHVKVIKSLKDDEIGCTFPYYGGYSGIEYTNA